MGDTRVTRATGRGHEAGTTRVRNGIEGSKGSRDRVGSCGAVMGGDVRWDTWTLSSRVDELRWRLSKGNARSFPRTPCLARFRHSQPAESPSPLPPPVPLPYPATAFGPSYQPIPNGLIKPTSPLSHRRRRRRHGSSTLLVSE